MFSSLTLDIVIDPSPIQINLSASNEVNRPSVGSTIRIAIQCEFVFMPDYWLNKGKDRGRQQGSLLVIQDKGDLYQYRGDK
jgi:hypothetical protein